jgi:hypothetical protein
VKLSAEAPGLYLVQRDVRAAVAVDQRRVELHSTQTRGQIELQAI